MEENKQLAASAEKSNYTASAYAGTNEVKEEENFDIKHFLALFLPKWYWFVLSVIVALALATLYLKRTSPLYTRSASLLIQNNDKRNGGGASALGSEFQNLGFFKSNQNIYNEMLTLTSPDLMTEVVTRLKLNETYFVRNGLRNDELYGDSPLLVTLGNPGQFDAVSFKITMNSADRATLSKIVYHKPNEDKAVKVERSINIQLGKNMKTPVGNLIINKTKYFKSATVNKEFTYTRGTVKSYGDAYAKKLSAELGNKEATIINLAITDNSKKKAEDILNTLIDVYNERWLADKNQIAVSTSHFIDERMAVIEKELDNVDEDISDYKSANKLPDIAAVSQQYLQMNTKNEEELLDLSSQISTAQYIQKQLQSKNIKQTLPVNTSLKDANIQSQISEYNKLVVERNKLMDNSGEENPLVIDYTNAIRSLSSAILQSIDNTLVLLDHQMTELAIQRTEIVDELENKPKQAKQLLSAERQQKVKESLYLYLLQKREENELNQAFTAYNTRIIQAPRGSNQPTSPKRMQIYLIAFALGLLVPGGLIYLKESMNSKVRGRRDLDKLSIPFVGEIPQSTRVEKKNKNGLFGRKKSRRKNEVHPLVVKERKRDILNEAFRVVRTNIEFMIGASDDCRMINVTSANPGSGKTFITMNLAMSLAIKKKKVAVIDFDMRRASLSEYVGSPSTGVSNYITGHADSWRDVAIMGQMHEYLDVIPVGTIPPNPTELLFNDRVKMMLDEMRETYDYVFIDCPPVEIVADSTIISKFTDMTLFIIRAELMERDMLPVIEELYQKKQFNNMATILNGTIMKHSGRYGYSNRYGYHYGYSYGYGYGYASSYYANDDDDKEDKKKKKKK